MNPAGLREFAKITEEHHRVRCSRSAHRCSSSRASSPRRSARSSSRCSTRSARLLRRARRAPRRATVRRAGAEPRRPDAETLAALDALHLRPRTEDRVPATVEARIERISATVRETIRASTSSARAARSACGGAHARRATARSGCGVPATCRATSPTGAPSPAARRRCRSCATNSISSARRWTRSFDAACRADADALIAHGRFLAEKFGSGALALDPEKTDGPE